MPEPNGNKSNKSNKSGTVTYIGRLRSAKIGDCPWFLTSNDERDLDKGPHTACHPLATETDLAHLAEAFGQLIAWCQDPAIAECMPMHDANGEPSEGAGPFWECVERAERALAGLRSHLPDGTARRG